MLKELETASRVICERLRQRPYQKGVTITAWNAVIDQLLDGRRYGAFSWHKAVETEVRRYIGELDEATKRKIWDSSEDAAIIPIYWYTSVLVTQPWIKRTYSVGGHQRYENWEVLQDK